jgi:hypothetical protein
MSDGTQGNCAAGPTDLCACSSAPPADPCALAANPTCTAKACTRTDGTVGKCGKSSTVANCACL